MSKFNNLIGFWNNKSFEAETVNSRNQLKLSPNRPQRPKSEVLDNGFSGRMEYFASSKGSRGEKCSPRVTRDTNQSVVSNIKDNAKCNDKSDDSDQSDDIKIVNDKNCNVKQSRGKGDALVDTSRNKCEISSSTGKNFSSGYSSAPVSPLVKCPPSLPSTPTSPSSPGGWSSPTPKSTKSQSPFAKFRQLESNVNSNPLAGSRTPPLPSKGSSSLYRNLSMPASTPRPTLTVKMMDEKQGQGRTGGGNMAARSGSGAKEMILMWVQNRIKDYPIPMTNFSTCWNDGLAFCALIHVFYPDNFDWFSLKPENRRHNFTLAFQKAEELAGIYPLLEVDDMVRFQKPDWKCVFTYVQSFYRRFRDGRSPPPRPGSSSSQPAGGQIKLSEVALAVAESQAAEEKGKQLVQQIKSKTISSDTPTPTEAKDKKTKGELFEKKQKDVNEDLKSSVNEAKSKEENSIETTEKVETSESRLSPVQVTVDEENETKEKVEEIHTQVASITLKPSPKQLSPTSDASTTRLSRSKSVNSEHPATDNNSPQKERKFSCNHPIPTTSPPALKL